MTDREGEGRGDRAGRQATIVVTRLIKGAWQRQQLKRDGAFKATITTRGTIATTKDDDYDDVVVVVVVGILNVLMAKLN